MNSSNPMSQCVGFRGNRIKMNRDAFKESQSATISRIYSGFGVRVKMVHRKDNNTTKKIPTVQELIDKLMNKQHDDNDFPSSATTPTGHLTQSDLIQSLDSRNEDCRASSDSTAGLDTSRRSKGRNHDLDRRPPSHNAMKSIQLSNGRVPPPLLDTSREFEGMRLQNSLDDKSLSHRKSGYFKPNGLRSAFNEKFSQNGTGQEDLIATGTILNSVPSTSSKSLSKSFNSVVGGNHSSGPAFSTSTSVGHSTRSTRLSLQRPPLQTNYQRQQKQTSEPKYADPLNGAEVVFQQRLAELATLEADTVRWERNRKMKKKNRDRDS